MGKKALDVTQDVFDQEVLNSTTPVLVDFGADWCPPCKMIDPIVDQITEEYAGKLRVVKLNTDTNPDMIQRYGIMGLPTLILFKNGEAVERVTGFKPKNQIVAKIASHI